MSADLYWKRNNTCIDYLKNLVIYKLAESFFPAWQQEQDSMKKVHMAAEFLKDAETKLNKMIRACGGANAIEGITEEFQDECWSKLEHPEWFETEGHYGSPYFIKPYLALAVKHGLSEQAYKFLNDPTKFPHVNEPPETPIEEKTPDTYGDWTVYYDATNKKWFLHNEKTATDSKLFDHKPTLEEIKEAVEEKGEQPPPKEQEQPNQVSESLSSEAEQQLPCESIIDGEPTPEMCQNCLDPCTDYCSHGVHKAQIDLDPECENCEDRECEEPDALLDEETGKIYTVIKERQITDFFGNQQNP